MDDAELVGLGEGFAGLERKVDRLGDREPTALADPRGQKSSRRSSIGAGITARARVSRAQRFRGRAAGDAAVGTTG